MKASYIKPITGQTYQHHNGGTYICLKGGEGKPGMDMKARFERQPDGWTFTAHGVAQYDDGTIEWDFSTGGAWPDGQPKSWK